MDRTGFISLLLWDREATNLIGKSANELNESSIETSCAVDECSYPVELYDILNKKILFKVTVKNSNIKVHAKVYNVVKISEDDNLIQQYSQSPQDDTFTDPDFECEQHTDADTTFKDSMADNEMTYPAKTHAKKISTNISIR
ncbi:uncharacterized protein [Nicotiana tomentosiformis]|uniref:uncharacterized protein n=1 Tax=Nicotiana tomentosiformis TaxID=4098 RepID=UPI00388CA1AC